MAHPLHNSELAIQSLQRLPAPNWDWSKLRLPDWRCFSSLLLHSHDNSPGFDGLPFSAHQSRSQVSAVLMDKMFAKLRLFDPAHPTQLYEFNHLVQACIPKKIVYPFEQDVACRAEVTRS